MKKLSTFFVAAAFLTLSVSPALAGSMRVESDKAYRVKMKCNGSSKTITIRAGTTTVTFDSTSSSCDIAGGAVKWPVKKVTNNSRWKIKNGVAKKN